MARAGWAAKCGQMASIAGLQTVDVPGICTNMKAPQPGKPYQ
jgi:hypothetical protein